MIVVCYRCKRVSKIYVCSPFKLICVGIWLPNVMIGIHDMWRYAWQRQVYVRSHCGKDRYASEYCGKKEKENYSGPV
jgi:hypothetical protein